MPKYSVKKPFTILVAVILVLVLGFVSLTGIQTDLLPAMNLPYLMVITTYPGASPEQVEADVTKPLENALSTLNGVKNVTSQSNENYSLLFLEYQDDTDMDSAMVKASTAVNQLGDALPDMASTPTLMEISPDMMATQYIAVDYDGMDIYELSDYVSENVLPQLERVDGVASVSTTGLVEKSVQITLDQEKIDCCCVQLLYGGKILLNGFIKHLMNLLKNQFWWFHTVQIGVMLRKTHCKLFKIALIWEWIWLKLI